MKPSIQTLGQILYSPSQYVIPVFQRNYRWERPNWEKLWEGLLEIQKPEKRGNHFMGFLVFVPGLAEPGKHTTFHLIDGQQRLTTACVLLAALRNIARQYDQDDLADEICDYYLVHPLKKGEEHYRLLPKERDHDSYIAIVKGEGEPTGRLGDALGFFEEKLGEVAQVDVNRLRLVFQALCQRLEFMCATLEAENAYNIFKSLNSTGVPLGASDLIRNFVFMHVPPGEHDEFDSHSWGPLEKGFAHENGTLDEERFSRFFRDFLMAEGRYVSPKETFARFEERYEATGFVPRELSDTLREAARRYSIISGQSADESDAVTRALAGLNLLESSTTYPLLLALFERRARGQIDAEGLAKSIEMLRGFILRRFVCGESSRGYGQMFVRALADDEGAPLQTLEAFLLDRGWPDDHQFVSAFTTFPLYERGYAWEILETLERSTGHREPASLEDAQIEHVMPQTLNEGWKLSLGPAAEAIHKDWLHTPGNLTLSAYNQELWNHEFAIKRARYAGSNVVLTRELSNMPQWRDVEIRDRGAALGKKATAIWIGPKETVTREEEQSGQSGGDEPGRYDLRRRFWSGLKDHLAEDFAGLPVIEIRQSADIRISSGVKHIGFELNFGIHDSYVGLCVYFWREPSFQLWEKIQVSRSEWDELIGATWEFERHPDKPFGWMCVWRSVPNIRQPRSWPDAYRWLGERMAALYDKIAPRLRDEMDRLG